MKQQDTLLPRAWSLWLEWEASGTSPWGPGHPAEFDFDAGSQREPVKAPAFLFHLPFGSSFSLFLFLYLAVSLTPFSWSFSILFLSLHKGSLCFLSCPIILYGHSSLLGLPSSLRPSNTASLKLYLQSTIWRAQSLYTAWRLLGYKLYTQMQMTVA